LAAALGDTARPAEDRARDATSKPAEVLAFLGVAPGMTVLDMNAATGWYTEILARAVGPTGHVIAHNHTGARVLPAEAFEARYGGNRLPNVAQVFVRHNDLRLPAGSVDVVLMSMVYHDTYWHDDGVEWGPIDRQTLLLWLLDALKPGGVVGVVDHYAAAGADPFESALAVHRIDPAVVQRDFGAAGFEPAGESGVLRSTTDDYSLSVFDDAVVGRTDRFVLRFRKSRAARSAWINARS
jgi:predicted methyltransferase